VKPISGRAIASPPNDIGAKAATSLRAVRRNLRPGRYLGEQLFQLALSFPAIAVGPS